LLIQWLTALQKPRLTLKWTLGSFIPQDKAKAKAKANAALELPYVLNGLTGYEEVYWNRSTARFGGLPKRLFA
jgi:hypothetical protein